MNNINFNDHAGNYYAFMREIAENHVDIKHSDTNKHFYRGELEEFFLSLRNKVKFPALVVEGFELNYTETNPIVKYRESAFTVIFDYRKRDDFDAITDCFSKSEIIGEEILNQIKTYGKNLACQVLIENIHAVELLNETELYAGVRFSFSLKKIHQTKIDSTKWLNQG